MTPTERRYFRVYLSFRDRPMTPLGLAWASRRYATLLAVNAAAFVAVAYFDRPVFALLLVGMLVGALARDAAHFRASAAIWPALRAVIDWPKVERMLADDSDRTNTP